MVLGVPGNASAEEIEQAFAAARAQYTPERIAASESALDKFNELKLAYEILRKPDARAAHDRKIAGGHSPVARARAAVPVEEVRPTHGLLKSALVLLTVLALGGGYISYRNAEARREQAELELQARQLEAKEREQKRRDAEREAQAEAAARAKTEADERRFAAESSAAAQRATYERNRQEAVAAQMQRNAAMEAQRQDALRVAEERRNAMEARNRVEADKRRIRELCMLQYRRPDC
jgi:curved DNA-binding protein CbpA